MASGIGPLPALELIREVALRFPAVGVVLVSADPTAGLYSAAMDAGARGLAGLPLSYEELAARVAADVPSDTSTADALALARKALSR